MTFCVGHVLPRSGRGAPDHISREPVAPLSAYEDWVAERNLRNKHGSKIAPYKVRRMVVMKRQHEPNTAIHRATGLATGTIAKLLVELPPELL